MPEVEIDSRARAKPWLGALLVGILAISVQAPIFGGGFLWCDDYTVAANPAMRDLRGIGEFWRFGTREQFYPLTDTLYWASVQLLGPGADGLHAVNVLLHALGAVLLGALLCRLGLRGAWLAAGLFAVHPLQVESVAWIYELRNPWSFTLLMVAAHAHLSFLRRGSGAALSALLVAYAAALLAKSTAVVYPALALLLFGVWFRDERRRRLLDSLVPLAALAAVSAALTIWYERHYTITETGEWPGTFAERAAIAGHTFWFYLAKFVAPLQLSFHYPRYQLDGATLGDHVPGMLALVTFAVLACCARSRGMRAVWWTLVAYLVAVFPVLGFFDIYAMRYTFVADHFAYLAVATLAPLTVGALGWLGNRLAGSSPTLRLIPCLVALAALGATAIARVTLFRSETRVWEQALEVNPDAWLPHVRLGLLAKAKGDVGRATEHFEAALDSHDTLETRIDLANALVEQHRYLESLPHYRAAVARAPSDLGNRISFASALAVAGLIDAAAEQYDAVLALQPDQPLARRNREALRKVVQDLDREIARVEGIVQRRPMDAQAWARLTDVTSARGLHARARQAALRWAELDGENRQAHLAVLRVVAVGPVQSLRDPDLAREHADLVLALAAPANPAEFELLAAALALAQQAERAVDLATRGLELAERAGAEALAQRLRLAREHYAEGLPPP